MINLSTSELFMVANLCYHSIDNTKLPCCTLPQMQHLNFYRNLSPLFTSQLYLAELRQPIGLYKNSLFAEFLPVQFEVCTTTSRAWHAKHYAIIYPLYISLYSLINI